MGQVRLLLRWILFNLNLAKTPFTNVYNNSEPTKHCYEFLPEEEEEEEDPTPVPCFKPPEKAY